MKVPPWTSSGRRRPARAACDDGSTRDARGAGELEPSASWTTRTTSASSVATAMPTLTGRPGRRSRRPVRVDARVAPKSLGQSLTSRSVWSPARQPGRARTASRQLSSRTRRPRAEGRSAGTACQRASSGAPSGARHARAVTRAPPAAGRGGAARCRRRRRRRSGRCRRGSSGRRRLRCEAARLRRRERGGAARCGAGGGGDRHGRAPGAARERPRRWRPRRPRRPRARPRRPRRPARRRPRRGADRRRGCRRPAPRSRRSPCRSRPPSAARPCDRVALGLSQRTTLPVSWAIPSAGMITSVGTRDSAPCPPSRRRQLAPRRRAARASAHVSSSSTGENGIGTSIAPMRWTGASRCQNAPLGDHGGDLGGHAVAAGSPRRRRSRGRSFAPTHQRVLVERHRACADRRPRRDAVPVEELGRVERDVDHRARRDQRDVLARRA